MFGRWLDPDEDKKLGTINSSPGPMFSGPSTMTIHISGKAEPFIPGSQTSNERTLGVINGCVWKGQAAIDAIVLNRAENTLARQRTRPPRSLGRGQPERNTSWDQLLLRVDRVLDRAMTR